MAVVPFGPWLPDRPAHGNPGLVTCSGCLPRSPDSYAPFPTLSVYSDALTARCQGFFPGLSSAGVVSLFAGDATKLYRLVAGTTTWENVSGATYTTGADNLWRFAQYGTRVIATNYVDAPQSYVLGSSTDFADLDSDAPKAQFIAVIRNFVFLGRIGGASPDPQKVRWSAIDDPTDWPTVGSADAAAKQSDEQTLAGDGGWIQGVVGGLGTADGAVFQERALWRLTYIGGSAIFSFDKVEGARGTPAPGSIIQLGAVCAYLGEDGFYLFDGTSSKPIGANVLDKTFFADLDQSYFNRISGTVDPINKIFFWSIPGANSSSGTPNKIYAYNWSLDRWSVSEAFEHEVIGVSQSFGSTLEDLDNISASLDDLPFSLDSRAWTGGRPLLAAFNTDHKLAFFTGSNQAATFETGDLDLAEGRRIFVSGIRPIVDGGTVTAQVGYRDDPDDSVSYTTATSRGADRFCPQRISTGLARARINIASGGTWTHAKGVEPRFKAEGLR